MGWALHGRRGRRRQRTSWWTDGRISCNAARCFCSTSTRRACTASHRRKGCRNCTGAIRGWWECRSARGSSRHSSCRVRDSTGRLQQTGTGARRNILEDGRPYSLQRGKVFLFYFDPACMHCFASAQGMSKLHCGDTRVVGVPISQGQFATQFMQDTGFHMAITTDRDKLKEVFPYAGVPAGVVIENGRQKAALAKFDGEEPAASLKQLGPIRSEEH